MPDVIGVPQVRHKGNLPNEKRNVSALARLVVLIMLSRFKEEIKEMASLVFIQGVVFLTQFIILLLEKTGEETGKI